MAIPQHMDRPTFLSNVHQSGLLSPEQIAAAGARLPETNRGRLVARSLVEQGLLTKFQTSAVGNVVRLYIVQLETNATTYQDGGGALGTSDATLTSETLLTFGAKQIGPTNVQHATNANFWSGRFIVYCRYIQIALWNASSVALTNTDADHEFHLNPVNREGQ